MRWRLFAVALFAVVAASARADNLLLMGVGAPPAAGGGGNDCGGTGTIAFDNAWPSARSRSRPGLDEGKQSGLTRTLV